MISSGQATPQTGLGAEINEQNVRSICKSFLTSIPNPTSFSFWGGLDAIWTIKYVECAIL